MPPEINKEFPYDATSSGGFSEREIFDRNFHENTFMGERRESAVWK